MHLPPSLVTVATSYARAVAHAASDDGHPALPSLSAANARLPFPEVCHLWDRAIHNSRGTEVGLRLGADLRPPALHVLGHLVLTCVTLSEAAATAVRYHPLVSEAGEVSLIRGTVLSRVVYRPVVAPDAMHPQQIEAVLAGMVTAARWLAGPGWAPDAVAFTHQPTGDLSRYEAVLGCPVSFGAADAAILVATSELDRRLNLADPELAAVQRSYADRLLGDLAAAAAEPARIRRWLTHAPLGRVGPSDLQKALHMSDRALRRALREQGTSWRELLDEARRTRACRLLETTDLTIDRIARDVGLSGAAALCHAFARWQDTSPGAYRRARRAGSWSGS
ncbi:AraC family transcriptional regulator [Streptomyces sp. NPDC047028]|uniref:AraC family transcriptional regulator n=1 Tax=Streptomyces sp. NPDC047028 TaxID=3155793 RepID=UPI0033D051F6